MPPQQLALELGPADNPGIRDETGAEGRRQAVPGAGHVREETPSGSAVAGGVTPDHPVREKGRESHPYVFVLDKHGRPLQPCTPARARKLLNKGRAVVHRRTPGCGGFVRHRLLASSETAGHVSVSRMLVCVDTASAPDGCQVVRCFVAWARR
ncbi:RRXRR domain-containing protein [Nonomuraea sp. CA-141351]|uniref:RRXRR domain-containing protein n=1 Tax=Nonomuraea sp. CA-141351 TaxID=3239996 RepID=UPI003D922CBE